MSDKKGLKILLAVDGSTHSDYAVTWYLKHFHRKEDEVLCTFVTPSIPAFEDADMEFAPAMEDYNNQVIQGQVKAVEERVRKLLEKQTVNYTFVHRVGNAGDQLCLQANQERVGIVILGTRGLSTWRRTILGSVSDFVLHHADVPVTICRK